MRAGTQLERSAMYNASRGTYNAQRYFMQGETKEDLQFTLEDLEKVNVGDNFTIVVNIKVLGRTININAYELSFI
jgi:hypothetical protein